MITLGEIADSLVVNELSLSNLVDLDKKIILPSNYNRLITAVNAALSDISTRFVLQQSELHIKTRTGLRDYVLDPFVLVNGGEDSYIVADENNPFDRQVIGILGISDLEGRQLKLNGTSSYSPKDVLQTLPYTDRVDGHSQNLVFSTPDYRTLRVPINLEPSDILVNYRASYRIIPQIEPQQMRPEILESIQIDIPNAYLTAICFYVAHRYANAKGAETIGRGMFHQGNNYRSMYESECMRLSNTIGDVAKVPDFTSRMAQKGFI